MAHPDRMRRILTPLALAAAMWALGGPAAAQTADRDICRSAATDTLASARRARSALADRRSYEAQVERRFAAMMLADAEHDVEDDMVVQLHFMNEATTVDGYRLCGAAGGPAAALVGGWTGVGLDARDTAGWWAARVSLVSGGDSLSPADFVADDGAPVSPDAMGTGYVFWLVEAQVTEWVLVGYGGINDAEVRMSLGPDASGATASNSEFIVSDAPGRRYLRLGVPLLDVYAGFIIGEGLDFGGLARAPAPVPGLGDLALGGGVAHLSDEDLYTTALEAAWPLLDGRVTPALELVAAWPDARLRAARVRVDGRAQTSGRLLPASPTALGWGHAGLLAYAELSRFDSAALRAAGGQPAVGYVAGVAAQLGARAVDLEMGGFVARDRVATLTRLPDASGRSERGVNILIRVGW